MVNGLSGQRMLIALFLGIALLIVMVLKTKIQAFLALIITPVSAERWEASVSSSASAL